MSPNGLNAPGPLEGVMESDGVFRCRAMGVGIRPPEGFSIVHADAFSREQLNVGLEQRGVIFCRHPEPYPTLNPTFALGLQKPPRIEKITALMILRLTLLGMPHLRKAFSIEKDATETTLAGRPAASARLRFLRELTPDLTVDVRCSMAVVMHGPFALILSYSACVDGPEAYDETLEAYFDTLEVREGEEVTEYPWALLTGNQLVQTYARSPIRNDTLVRSMLTQSLTNAKLGAHADQITPLAVRCYRTRTVYTSDDWLPVGSSKIGGVPDLPLGTPWPTRDGHALPFLAQISFTELRGQFAGSLLPSQGLLSVFCDAALPGIQPEGACCVLITRTPTRLLRRADPDEVEPHAAPHEAVRLEFYESLSLPSPHAPWITALALGETERTTYSEYFTGHLGGKDAPIHQILGHPHETGEDDRLPGTGGHGGMEPSEPWVLLLQVDSHPELRGWCEGGRFLDIWVLRRELELRHIQHPQVILHGPPLKDDEDGCDDDQCNVN